MWFALFPDTERSNVHVQSVYSVRFDSAAQVFHIQMTKEDDAVCTLPNFQGYDMEDAMIINKGSYDRGFAHGSVYKSEVCFMHLSPSTSDCPSAVE